MKGSGFCVITFNRLNKSAKKLAHFKQHPHFLTLSWLNGKMTANFFAYMIMAACSSN